ncbi:ABC transporter ATP-binding protein [Terrarubrum flagellatum]|uniref:ABC transporter ATP-binding protein n=1 Tax=Terrirubrum flagellatum TaxID=2895980 RepID=UPI0031453EAE
MISRASLIPERRSLSPDQPFVEVRNLAKHYPLRGARNLTIKSVDGVSFDIREGEVLGLVGESGCGKSTIARLLMRLTDATAGEVRVDQRDILAMKGETLRRMRPTMQLVFQDPYSALDPKMTIGASMRAPLIQHGIGQPETQKASVLRMLEEVGLDSSFYDRYPSQCSGGQLQRIVIGRALLLKPWFLVCDEPTSALDASMRTQILNLLIDLRKRFNLTLLMISHDLRVIRYMCERIAVMYLGQIVEIADRDALFERPRHPYTRALISAAMIEETGLAAAAGLLKGDLPSPLNPPSGCRLHARCLHTTARCAAEAPLLHDCGNGHHARCHYWSELDLSSLAAQSTRSEATGALIEQHAQQHAAAHG